MKKLMIFPFVFLAFLLCGCTVSLDPDLSKVDEFTEVAEEMDVVFTEAKSTFMELDEQSSLSSNDQKTIEFQIKLLREAINNFKSTEAPFLVKTAKKSVAKELNKIDKKLIKFEEKAKNDEVKKGDLQSLIELVTDDIEINFWKK